MPRVPIAFLGQCHTTGYEGVPAIATFPQVARRVIEAQRHEVSVDVRIEYVGHPADLPRAMETAAADGAKIVVVEIVGWLAVTGRRSADLSKLPSRLRSAYARAQHLHEASRAMTDAWKESGAIATVRADMATAAGPMRRLLRRLPRPTVEEYAAFARDGIRRMREHPGAVLVIQGPGAFNRDLDYRSLPPETLEIYRAVDAMARRLAEEHRALYVDRWASIAPGFYLPGSIRPGVEGHAVWGHLLAEKLMSAGLV